MTPVTGSTFLVQFFVWKISTSLLFDKALSWVLSKYQSVLASPKINPKKCFGWNAIYRNKFGDFPSVFIWIRLEYKCTWPSYQPRRLLNSYLLFYAAWREKKSKWKKKTKQKSIRLYFHFAAQQVWYHAMKNLEWYIWKQKSGITFLHRILIGAKLRGSHVDDKLVA